MKGSAWGNKKDKLSQNVFRITRACLEVFLYVTHPHISVRIHWVPLKVLEKKSQDGEGPAQQGVFLCHQPGIVVVENSTQAQTLISLR